MPNRYAMKINIYIMSCCSIFIYFQKKLQTDLIGVSYKQKMMQNLSYM